MPKTVFKISASSLADWQDCPRRAYHKARTDGKDDLPKHPRQVVGDALHNAMYAYHQAFKGSKPENVAVALGGDAVRDTVEDVRKVSWSYPYTNKSDILNEALSLFNAVSNDRLIDNWKRPDALVESPLDDLYFSDEVALTGRPDYLYEWDDKVMVLDVKTGQKPWASLMQLGAYAKILKHSEKYKHIYLGILAARNPAEIELLKFNTDVAIVNADTIISTAMTFITHTGHNRVPPNPASVLCHQKYCPAWEACTAKRNPDD